MTSAWLKAPSRPDAREAPQCTHSTNCFVAHQPLCLSLAPAGGVSQVPSPSHRACAFVLPTTCVLRHVFLVLLFLPLPFQYSLSAASRLACKNEPNHPSRLSSLSRTKSTSPPPPA